MRDLLSFALRYGRLGWRVIPLHTPMGTGACSCGNADCEHIGKHPRLKDWQRRASADERVIRRWWEKWPDANIGIACGPSSGIVVLDRDDEHAELSDLRGPVGPVVQTSGKRLHFYCAMPAFDLPNAVKFAPGWDMRAAGGLVVAPPSLHESGSIYHWLHEPESTLPDLPAWVPETMSEAPETLPSVVLPSPAQWGASVAAYVLAALEGEADKVRQAPEGERNNQLNKSAFALGTLVGAGELDGEQAAAYLLDAASECGLSTQESRQTIISGLEAGAKKPRKVAPASAPKPAPIGASCEESDRRYPETSHTWTPAAYTKHKEKALPVAFVRSCLSEGEYGDAQLFARLYAGRLVYDHDSKAWFVWGGHSWYLDRTGLVFQLVAGQLPRQYLRAASDLAPSKSSADTVEELTARAFKLRDLKRAKAVLTFATSLLGITGEEWDSRPWLLGVANGVIDLRTGKLRPGKPDDFIRTVSPTEWKGPKASAPRWEQFINEVFDNNQAIAGFVGRLLGYSIAGLTTEHVFPIFWGARGRNGKDTMLETLLWVLGANADSVSTDVVMTSEQRSGSGSAQPHMADLQGKRLVWASEPEKGARLSVNTVKYLTGGGTIKTRALYSNMVSFKPTHTMILLTNDKPKIDAEADALWSRLVLIPFTLRFVREPKTPDERPGDPLLKFKLRQEAPGILAWLVRHCLIWQRDGLNPPIDVQKATNDYRDEEDTIGQFIDECCVIAAHAHVTASDLYKTYREWIEDQGSKPLSQTNFGKLVVKRFERKKGAYSYSYIGIGLLTDEENHGGYGGFGGFSQESQIMSANMQKVSQSATKPTIPTMQEADTPPGKGAAEEGAAEDGAQQEAERGGAEPVQYYAPYIRRRERVKHARDLLKRYGTTQEIAQTNITGMTDAKLEAFISTLEQRQQVSE